MDELHELNQEQFIRVIRDIPVIRVHAVLFVRVNYSG